MPTASATSRRPSRSSVAPAVALTDEAPVHSFHCCVTTRFEKRASEVTAEPEFAPSTWQAFQRLAVDGRPAAEVAAELGTTVNAVLLAKSRVLRRLRQEARGLVD